MGLDPVFYSSSFLLLKCCPLDCVAVLSSGLGSPVVCSLQPAAIAAAIPTTSIATTITDSDSAALGTAELSPFLLRVKADFLLPSMTAVSIDLRRLGSEVATVPLMPLQMDSSICQGGSDATQPGQEPSSCLLMGQAISTDQLSTGTPNGSGALQILSLLSDFLDFLRNLCTPQPSFAHGKRDGGINLSVLGAQVSMPNAPLLLLPGGSGVLIKKDARDLPHITEFQSSACRQARPGHHYPERNEKPSLPGTKMKHNRRRQQAQAALRMKGKS